MSKFMRILLSFLFLAGAGYLIAEQIDLGDLPKGAGGVAIQELTFLGVESTRVGYSGTATDICTTPCLLYGWVLSTGAATDYSLITDTVTPTALLRAFPHSTSTTVELLRYPIQMENGIAVDNATANTEVLILYREFTN